jgi:hypothetical protein
MPIKQTNSMTGKNVLRSLRTTFDKGNIKAKIKARIILDNGPARDTKV